MEPRTEVEATLAKLWAETLRLDRVGVHDDFFDLGGHSLAIVRPPPAPATWACRSGWRTWSSTRPSRRWPPRSPPATAARKERRYGTRAAWW
ncbi:phosphopantetheine-binding protein [Micromonospora sp. BRA006-A]|nr:phosphopantetheine-binding protein [Micromonospora sp. BRA006-A]